MAYKPLASAIQAIISLIPTLDPTLYLFISLRTSAKSTVRNKLYQPLSMPQFAATSAGYRSADMHLTLLKLQEL